MAQHRTARRPLIGVTAGSSTMMSGAWAGHDAVTLTTHYVTALRAAGARVVILAPQEEWSTEELSELDAIVLTGGTDVDPARYGKHLESTGFAPDPERDAFEIALYRTARQINLPVLGICRGLQLIVIAEGGSLHSHLPVDLPACPRTDTTPTTVEVSTRIDSDVALALGERTEVTAFHHQGIDRVPAALRVVARHRSGLPLAVEGREGALLLGVQWHPELDLDGHGLFRALVTAVASRAEVGTIPAPGLR